MKIQISKTKIKKNIKRKTSPLTIEVLSEARKHKFWLPLAKIISGPTRRHSALNLDEINKQVNVGEIAVVPGKVLGVGEITKKIKICALSFSSSALDKLKKSKMDYSLLNEEIKKNHEAKGVKILE
jgi:large subunit ribosomal protein L18e